ncbi:hypothetical protein CROQUDRAFT_70717 [Cronartium quercuum f. sp. fusiforme G11]|uniref:Zn(2)-C6 fungal-type domain-containing protein n=1 Tax=Cronartium quercuum f. sp. fusiforme G11 TaxID=708437 RepID=A0A9P6NUI0_9BASI|nr:hypothetical protein CROQUDRAFT_70717 [Cronartium quercuum f. sp. fusiforme G11]
MPLASTSNPTITSTLNCDTHSKPKTVKRRKVAKACLFCKRSHMTCDDSRPCQRCIKREISHLCCDEPPSSNGSAPPQQLSQSSIRNIITQPQTHAPVFTSINHTMLNHSHASAPITNRLDIDPSISTPIHLQNSIRPFQSPSSKALGPAGRSSVNPINSTALTSVEPTASSLDGFLNLCAPITSDQKPPSELDLNDILMSYPGLFTEPFGSTSNSGSAGNPSDGLLQHMSNFNDRSGGTRTNEVTLFDYQRAEQRLLDWINLMALPDSKQKLLRILAEVQPAILAVTSTLSPSDKIESDLCYHRLLQEYTPIFSTLPIPACVWRRTGEIVKTNSQFCELIGMTRDGLEGAQKSIYELWNDDSNLNYWEKYGRIALDEGQKAVLTSCVLIKKSTQSTITKADPDPIPQSLSCTFSFTIRRDAWAVPSLIVGNFLPC